MAPVKSFVPALALLVTAAVTTQTGAQTHTAARLISGPEVEMSTGTVAIIRWMTTNPGGTHLHYGIVRYGTDAASLTALTRSPNRRNPSHADMIFRVRITGLDSHTTYYYAVESTGATDASDGVSSPVGSFKTK
jgi:phosphodiesterase/alkaline phosphatase D-like protein